MIFPLPNPATLLVLAAVSACPQKPPPVVSLSFTQKPAVFDNSQSVQQLSQVKVDTVVAHKANEVFTTGGITSGKLKAGFRVNFKKMINPETGAGCVWADSVDVSVDYDPTVFIARDYPVGSCRYNAIADHERRHVSTDIITIQEYNEPLRANIQREAATLGSVYADNETQMKVVQTKMTDKIQDVLSSVMIVAETVRAQRQQQIDTRQEYLRLSKLCR